MFERVKGTPKILAPQTHFYTFRAVEGVKSGMASLITVYSVVVARNNRADRVRDMNPRATTKLVPASIRVSL